MERLSVRPRENWQSQVEALGLTYHTWGGNVYWDESTCYQLTTCEIQEIATATNEIEGMCIAVVEEVVQHQRYSEFDIPAHAWKLIEDSWYRGDQHLYGRLDLSYNGNQPPKLLEYNADTPTTLLESSLVQKHWLEQVRPGSDQFNSIHERLVAVWPQFGPDPIHLIGREQYSELLATNTYMAKTIIEAGLEPKLQHVDKIVWNDREFVDSDNVVVKTIFKLYPWEWLIHGAYGTYAPYCKIKFIEPIWKMILSNKALMVLLWELFPDHPNLLPAYFDPKKIHGDYVKKPLLGRKGENVSLYSAQGKIMTKGSFSKGPFMYQQSHPLPNLDSHYPLLISWLIKGQASGIGIREDQTPISTVLGHFVPHFVA